MPRHLDGYRTMSLDVLDELAEAMKNLADANGRTLREEVNHAFRRHLDCPPRMVAPPLPSATATPEPKRKAGRPRKTEGGPGGP